MKARLYKSPKPRTLAGLGLLLATLALGGWWYQYNQTPSTGIVSPPAIVPQAKGVTTTHFKSATIAFDYPTEYASVENKSVVAPTLELYTLSMHDSSHGSRRITVTVKQSATTTSMTEDSAYAFRKLHPEEYGASDVALSKQTAKRLAKKDGSEITYFVPGSKAYAIIATTTSKPEEAFDKEIAEVIHSFGWVL